MTDPQRPVSSLRQALLCRCPRCGDGPVFTGVLTVVRICWACGLDLSAYDTGDGPAALVIMVLGTIVVGLALWVELRYEPPFWVHALLWTPLIIAGSIALLRVMKAWLVGQHYRYLPPE